MKEKRILVASLVLELLFSAQAGCPPRAAESNTNCYSIVAKEVAKSAYELRQLCWQMESELISVETEDDLSLVYDYMNLLYADEVSNELAT
ncbi:hypothetical protein LSH36_572g00065 [Paralvinella palmiformis]|uniref:Uncharacterized protein n=1 Tax=Paralvinella palmiformis TaxID=53620 RepID=A0AAD9MX70_9ANNE|nr:hypothetical protein LSH36_572g00065 [Paralvinella palmiformis]